ncbi:class I SAM-dependent methyltransferase [Hankyongella ginsenosidimutans]|uniref:Class I SAM-dependent methyltransferase n=1 Tax=Hankyongella ginsenosidimutans TaxID=1763828 RepID=A0A4D7CBK1_9SPHN|nr:SAM-dependent methyltransferase [Hankyongella ginsenosidimutans]QCI79736.1 class I SAM-dependent methyltransferase [Hankyongella ginsenosidimutans]TXG82105.1 MAG: class I SAM-dependent methyltransferase [Sphingomonadales bacterium]
MSALLDLIRAEIAASGPMRVDRYMALCLSHPQHGYYMTRDPLGARGDFITAPEISQMFGELIGLWLVDLWQRAGAAPFHLVELGPGRGTLMADALRAAGGAPGFAQAVRVHFVEISPALRIEQAARVPQATHHDSIETLPDDAPLFVIANEFFDALPVRHWLLRPGAPEGLSERLIDVDGDRLVWQPAQVPAGTVIVEQCPAAEAVAQDLAARIAAQGGALLAIDYGYDRPGVGSTLQALARHAHVDPLEQPGEADLTAHVNFRALGAALGRGGLTRHGPVSQGQFLRALGLDVRAATLVRANADATESIMAAMRRLSEPDQMGELFKVLAATAPSMPTPAGFA